MGRTRRVQPGPHRRTCGRSGSTTRPIRRRQQVVDDRRQRQHERGRPALPRVGGDERARAGPRRRAARRRARPAGRRGAARPRLRPPRVRRGQRGDAGRRRPRSASGSRRTRRRSARCCSTSPTSTTALAPCRRSSRAGVVPAAMEMMDRGIVRAVEAFAHAGYPTEAAAVLLIEVDGSRARGRRADRRRWSTPPPRTASAPCASPPTRRSAPSCGRAARARSGPSRGSRRTTTCTTAWCRARSSRRSSPASTRSRGATTSIVTNVFHAGDGNLHPLFSFDRSVPGTLERALAASDELVELCVEAGGALSGEHGIGLEKRDFMPLMFSQESLAVQACLRDAFDPSGRMNPEKVLPAGARCGEFAAAAMGRDGSAPGGHVDLIHPADAGEVVDAVRRSRAAAAPVVGGRRHMARRGAVEVDAELWTSALDRLVAYDPAEMLCVVEAGMRLGDLRAALADGGQEWPIDEPDDATVGRRDRGRRRSGAPAARRDPARLGRRDGGRPRRRPARDERRPRGEERLRVRRPPAPHRVARHARGHHAGRAEGPAAAGGAADPRHARGRARARSPPARRRSGSRRPSSPNPTGSWSTSRAGPPRSPNRRRASGPSPRARPPRSRPCRGSTRSRGARSSWRPGSCPHVSRGPSLASTPTGRSRGSASTWIPCRDATHAAEIAARAEAAVTCRAEIPEPSRRERSALEERIRVTCDPGDTFAGRT